MKPEGKQRIFKFTKNITKYLILLLCFWLSTDIIGKLWMYGSGAWEISKRNYMAFCILYIVILLVFWLLFEAYGVEQRRLMDLVYGQFFGAVCTNVFFCVLMCAVSDIAIGRLIIAFLKLLVIEAAVGIVWVLCFFNFYLKCQSCKNALFIYGNRENEEETIQINNHINSYFKIVDAVHYSQGTEKLEVQIEPYEAVYLGEIPYEERNQLMKYCLKKGIECYSVPKISDIYIQNTDILQLHDKVLLKYRSSGIKAEKAAVKRAMDIIVALLMLAAASPFMLIIMICIKAEDGGPILYRQDRVTIGGQAFQMLKFRSMRVDAEKDGARLAAKNDSRVTRIGKIIRNIHFDELPQLINILKGDMSVVGPRPERMEFIEEYSKIIPEFRERLKVRGGLTGYAQIYSKYNTGPEEKAKYDLMYIYNYSLRLDIKLVFLTLRILFQKENTEGVEEEQKSAVKDRNIIK